MARQLNHTTIFEAHAPSRRPLMLREIREEPQRITTLLDREGARLNAVLARFRETPPPLILVAARGTSDNAADFGRYLFEHFAGVPVSGAALSLFTLYPAPLHLRGALAIGLSQSGESSDVVEALLAAREAGAFTLGITNVAQSSLAKAADHTVLLHAQKERSVAATKTYINELVAMAMTCRAIGGAVSERELRALPEAVANALACEDTIAGLAPYYRYAQRLVCLARGFNFATARETALKLMETCYIGATGMSAADFLHGPIAFIEHDTPILLLASRGPTYPFMVDLAKTLQGQGVDALCFTDKPEILRYCTLGVTCSMPVMECLTPIPFATLGQLFACHLALVRNISPDAPRRLHKVTQTR